MTYLKDIDATKLFMENVKVELKVDNFRIYNSIKQKRNEKEIPRHGDLINKTKL